ncbi:disease resistance protein RUN1-like [Telopea speciosissima]|uniref:disease resistance protein RUN1-like n=1 Tax=Telopea speciosissima TaxID=54955 RepID=UPI001CC7C665|nr:disease resistance protein RUN1-like [Telopea speciosissima]
MEKEAEVGCSDKYDVFINFRGEDTRNIFVGHLYSALKGCGIHTFIDSKDLQKGEDIGKLLRVIEGAKLSIAVFSHRYVESRWCLQELAQMVKSHRTNGQIILPIFFMVKTSHVKNHTGCFEILPQMHSEEAAETRSAWEDALRAAGDMSGWVVDERDDQSVLVKEVVQNAWIQLNKVPLIDVKNSVGLESRVQRVLFLLSNSSSKDVQFLGICGQGGIGKTTIATTVYNCISEKFSKSCFLENVREQESQTGIVCLQEKLLYGISSMETKISNSREGSRLIKERFQNMKTLLILDDVGDRTQLDALTRDLDWFGLGSVIIITTRDRSVLSGVPENNRMIYEPRVLNKEESLRLFSLHVFSTDQPPDDFRQLSVDIVRTTGGLPLALEILGSDLSMTKDKEDKALWESILRMLKQIPHDIVYEKLKISFDTLHDIEKAMFLDVACLFIGWEEETVISIWKACGFEPIYCMEVLKRKSLIKSRESFNWEDEKYKRLWMHDQIRDMGRSIAYNQRPDNPDNHSRLWSPDNIMKVLKSGKGNQMVEGLLLHTNENICLHTKNFKMMPKLRLLTVGGATMEGSFQCLPSKLRWFRWHGCPLKKLPASFCHEGLVMLDLPNGRFRQTWNNWHGNKVFQQLKVLRLSHCYNLFKSPDFSGFPLLERLDLSYCEKLVNLNESLGKLQQLVYLNLKYCHSLEKLPNSICRLRSLQNLILTECKSLREIPVSMGDLKESLVELDLARTTIEALHDGIGLLKKLKVLNLDGSYALMYLPSSMEKMTSLRYFNLSGLNKLLPMPKLPSRLIEWYFCTRFDSLPDIHQNMKNLEQLHLGDYCVKMEKFRGFVKTKTKNNDDDDEFSDLINKVDRRCCVVTNHRSWQTAQGQLQEGTAFAWGNIESWRQIWIPLQQKTDEMRDKWGCHHLIRHYLIPDDEICSSRLIMHVSLSVTVREEDYSWIRNGYQDITLWFNSRVHSKDDKKIDCEIGLAIEGMNKLKGVGVDDHIEYIHEFKGFEWFGIQLKGRDAIEISDVYVNYPEWGKLRGLNLFLAEDGNHQFSTDQKFLEIVRYPRTDAEDMEEDEEDIGSGSSTAELPQLPKRLARVGVRRSFRTLLGAVRQ